MWKARTVLVTFSLLLLGQLSPAEETSRTWTNQSGKSVRGVLKEKGDGWVKILIKSRIHKIPLETLSKEDQEYAREARLYKTLRMKVTTVKAESSNGERGGDLRKLKVSLENVQERTLKFRLVWIAQTKGRSTYGAHRVVDVDYDKDGDYFHQEAFHRRSINGAQYKGFAARLVDEQGVTLAQTASMAPFLRFLDEADRKDQEKEEKRKQQLPNGPARGANKLIPD